MGYKLYDFSDEIIPEELDEQIRLLCDLLYNQRFNYPGQLGGGQPFNPFESLYGSTGGAGLGRKEILARMPRGFKIDPDNSPFVISPNATFDDFSASYATQQFSINLPGPYPAASTKLLGGRVPKNYYGRIFGYRVIGGTAGVHDVKVHLVDGTTAEAPAQGNLLVHLTGQNPANTKFNLLLNEGEILKSVVTNASAPATTNPMCWVSWLAYARWPFGELAPGDPSTSTNIKFIRLKNVAVVAGTDLVIYTCPAGKVAFIDPNFIGVFHTAATSVSATSNLDLKLPGNASDLLIRTAVTWPVFDEMMFNPFIDIPVTTTVNWSPYLMPILEPGDELKVNPIATGNMNVFFHVYERDIETLTTAVDPLSGKTFATGGVDPF